MIVPKYIRGESIAGYTQRCRGSREMRRLPLDGRYKTQICQEHAELAREYIRQPFKEDK
jgi:hypothetical protein